MYSLLFTDMVSARMRRTKRGMLVRPTAMAVFTRPVPRAADTVTARRKAGMDMSTSVHFMMMNSTLPPK